MLRTRLAPSPTGYLHLGNARSFLLAWLDMRARGGEVILRIEDIDRPRSVPGADAEIVRDLSWLGLDWDNPLSPEYYQSNRIALYRESIERLRLTGRLYECYCSRRELRAIASAPHGREPVYPGTCRDRARGSSAAGKPPALRFRTMPEDRIAFTDRVHGLLTEQVDRDTGDFIVARADGVVSYQLAVVVDDLTMGITDVVRGDDLLKSTGRQILLHRALGAVAPSYAHVPMLAGPDGERLAKRHGAVSLAELRHGGSTPEAVVGWLAWSCGLAPAPAPIRAAELVPDFAVTNVRAVAHWNDGAILDISIIPSDTCAGIRSGVEKTST